MDNHSSSPEQIASAHAGILCATTAMAAAGSALGAATIIASLFWHHPHGQQLTGPQALFFLIGPLFASFIPVILMLFFGGRSKGHAHAYGH